MNSRTHLFTPRPLAIALAPLVACASPWVDPRPEEPYAGPTPVVVVLERDPWLHVLGADTPTFALYDDGTVIYATDFRTRDTADGQPIRRYSSVRLAGSEHAALLAALTPAEDYYALANRYDIADWSDAPTTELYTNVGGRPKRVSVYGSLRAGSSTARRDELPATIGQLFDTAVSFSHPEATDWTPRYIEILVSRRLPSDWPAGWPRENDELTWRRAYGYSLYLPGERLPELRTYLASKNGDIDFSCRYAFPHDGEWYAVGQGES